MERAAQDQQALNAGTLRSAEPNDGADTRAYHVYVLGLLLAINTFSYADRHIFSILIPAIKAEFGVKDSVLGLLSGPGFIISYVLLTLPLARLGDRWSRRGVVAISAALWSLASAACGMATHIIHMATARVLVGVGEAGAMPSSQAMVSNLFSERTRSGALGVLTSSTYVGMLVGLTGGAAIAGVWGWRVAFLALSLPGVLLAVLLWLTGPKQEKQASPPVTVTGQGGRMAAVRLFWATPSLRYLALGVGVFNIFGYAGATWLPAFLVRSHGLSVVQTGVWLGIGAAIGGIAGSLASGVLVDIARRRDEAWQLRIPALGQLISFPLTAIMFLLPAGATLGLTGFEIPIVVMLMLVTSFLSALWAAPAYGAIARLIPPHQRAQAVGVMIVIINVVGSMLGPPLAGLVSDLLGNGFQQESMRYSLLAMSVLILIGGAFTLKASARYNRDLAHANSSFGRKLDPHDPGNGAIPGEEE